MSTMTAMVLEEQGEITSDRLILKRNPIPEPQQNELLIKVEACGVCHTDVHIAQGDLPLKKSPVILGHQVVGKVVKKNGISSIWDIGDYAGVPWVHKTCQKCKFCKNQQENLCDNPVFTGWTVDGGYAEYMTAPEDFAIKLPRDINPVEITPLLCGGIVGYRAYKLSRPFKGCKLGIYGFGSSAYLVLQIALHRGCDVYVFSRNEDNLKRAKEMGAAWVGHATETPPGKMNSAIVFAPAGNIVPLALKNIERGGTLALAGIYMSDIPFIEYNDLYWEKNIKSVANATRTDAAEFISLAMEIPVKTRIEEYPLIKANEALLRVRESKHAGTCVLKVS